MNVNVAYDQPTRAREAIMVSVTDKTFSWQNREISKRSPISPPQYSIISFTPSPGPSTVGIGLAIRPYNALGPMVPTYGTCDDFVDAMLGYICDYAECRQIP